MYVNHFESNDFVFIFREIESVSRLNGEMQIDGTIRIQYVRNVLFVCVLPLTLRKVGCLLYFLSK